MKTRRLTLTILAGLFAFTRVAGAGRAIPAIGGGGPVAAGGGAEITGSSVADLSGTWALEGFHGAAPLGAPDLRADFRAICPAGATHGLHTDLPLAASGPSAEFLSIEDRPQPHEQVTEIGTFDAELTIAQTTGAVSIERRYWGSLGSGNYKGVYQLDDSESVNVSGRMTSKTHSKWDGPRLVIQGRVTTLTGQSESVCAVTETFELGPNRALLVVATGEVAGHSRTSDQTYFAKSK
jgi:hypothetical protein